jgi:hypothetical protein
MLLGRKQQRIYMCNEAYSGACIYGVKIFIYIIKQKDQYDWMGKSDITPHWRKMCVNKSSKR